MTFAQDLTRGWRVVGEAQGIDVPLAVPGDVHSALISAGLIGDPYWRDTEASLDWIHESDWRAQCRFHATAPAGWPVLTFDGIDGVTDVVLNGTTLGHTDNGFLRYDFDLTGVLQSGENLLEVRFRSTSAEARRRAGASAIPAPYMANNCRLPHYNHLRKVQCDAGWDWNIALSPLGLTGVVRLRDCPDHRLDEVAIRQHHGAGRVRLEVIAHFDVRAPVAGTALLAVDGATTSHPYRLDPGCRTLTFDRLIEDPRLWWPRGHGRQQVYEVRLEIAGEVREVTVGLRRVALVTGADAVGHRFAIAVNGREIFMKGANWIPADALPQRATPAVARDLLTSAVEANMNMIRVWGGGRYEPEWFYDLCTELGIMVWQDFMFACHLYPAHDRAFLDTVRAEARQQTRRLMRHACVVLLCGDNELVGALGWYDESKADRDRYLAIYDRLNNALAEAVADEAPGIPWWPSSPSAGPLNFGDGWHDDTSGDMHFWDVWHEAKDFEHYRTVRPRFCSEFGFQSFPSPRLIDSFTEPQDRAPSSKVMEVHQRNEGGNARIVQTIGSYFHAPEDFEDLVYLSQVNQALAMRTAIEFWRAQKPRTMGTLYWQLNDTWPVASWSSLEHGGAWKLTHYAARRFFAPVLVTAQPDRDETVLWAVNDHPDSARLTIAAQTVRVAGEMARIGAWRMTVPPDRAVEVARLPAGAIPADGFLHMAWEGEGGGNKGENDYLPKRPAAYAFDAPHIEATETTDADGRAHVTLQSATPQPFVTWDLGGDTVWSDNFITLLPDTPRTVSALHTRQSSLPRRAPSLYTPRNR